MMELTKLVDTALLFLPSAIGAVLGMRYKEASTWRERALGFGLSMAAGYYLGGAIGAYFGLPIEVTWGIMFTLGAVGTEVIAYLFALLREGIASPTTAFGKWIDIIFGRRNKTSVSYPSPYDIPGDYSGEQEYQRRRSGP